MRFQATNGFCGCTSLAVGVQVVCFFGLMRSLITLCLVSSTEPANFMGIEWSPGFQIICGTWAVFGIFLAINAGVGGLYKLEAPLRDYFFYLATTCASDLCWGLYVLFEGKLCASLVEEETRRMGSHIVCSLTVCYIVFWSVFAYIVQFYFIYIVWSAAEEAKRGMQAAPELLHYIDKLYEELHDAKQKGGGAGYGAVDQGQAPGAPPPVAMPEHASVAEYGGWHTGVRDGGVEVLSGFVSRPLGGGRGTDDPGQQNEKEVAMRQLDVVLLEEYGGRPINFEDVSSRDGNRLRDGVARSQVTKVAEVMKKHPTLGFRIEVSAGVYPTESKEMKERDNLLAQSRAQEVLNELQKSNGVKNTLTAEGTGPTHHFRGKCTIIPV